MMITVDYSETVFYREEMFITQDDIEDIFDEMVEVWETRPKDQRISFAWFIQSEFRYYLEARINERLSFAQNNIIDTSNFDSNIKYRGRDQFQTEIDEFLKNNKEKV
jgi:hypothetical protein